MANPLFNSLFPGGNAEKPQQIPANAAPAQRAPQITPQDAMRQLQANPADMIRQAGFQVPAEIANNPQAAVMHILQSGQAKGPMMQRIQPMINMLMGRR